MKAMILGDTHGDTEYLRDALSIFEDGGYDKLFLTGDLLSDSIYLLNPYAEKIVACQGNQDSYFHVTDLASFPMPVINYSSLGGKFVAITHGHLYSEIDLPLRPDILITGHSHRGEIRNSRGMWVLNPGSLSQPRDHFYSYIVIHDGHAMRKSIKSGKILEEAILYY